MPLGISVIITNEGKKNSGSKFLPLFLGVKPECVRAFKRD